MAKHILLIAYTFPPYPGIGGRRWAKFAKYLVRAGYTVHVICAENPFSEESLFSEDVKDLAGLHVYPLPARYPKVLTIKPERLLQKLAYRFFNRVLPWVVNGSIYDKAVFWKGPLLKKAGALIKAHGITQVISTGAPFRANYYATLLRNEFPGLKLISDFRDPWIWGESYGYSQLSDKKKQNEQRMLDAVMRSSDAVLVPVAPMCQYLQEHYPNEKARIHILPHAFDTDEVKADPKTTTDEVRLLLYGTLYPGMESAVNDLAAALVEMPQVRLDFFTASNRYSDLFQSHGLLNTRVFYHAPLPPRELFSRFKAYTGILILQPDYAADFVTTKFYEIIYSRTPIVCIVKEGELSRFIMDHGVGLHCSPEQLRAMFPSLVEQSRSLRPSMDVMPFSFERVTQQLITCLK